MSYRVVLTRSATRELNGLPEKAGPAIVEALYGAISENPHRAGRPLSLQLEGKHAASRGEFRIVYEIEESTETVTVLRIGHRRAVYRTR